MAAESPTRPYLATLLGLTLWAAGFVAVWPRSVMFRDEVGYVGQARLVLEGRFRPSSDSVCYAFKTPRGEVPAYPPAFPIVIAPLLAVQPRNLFLSGLLASLLLAWEAARRLALWGREPAAGLLILAYPTVALLSRSVMIDVWLAALTLLAWRLLEQGRRASSLGTFVALVLAKPTGFILAVALIAVPWRRWLPGTRGFALAGLGLGVGVVLALNFVATGSPVYAYVHGDVEFGARYLATTAPVHLATLLFVPPGLFLGAVALVRRRAYSALAASLSLIAGMSAYYFVDRGRNWMETAVLSPRLILPAVVLLLLGMIDLLAEQVSLGRWRRTAVMGLALGVALVPPLVARATDRHEGIPAEALRAAEEEVARSGARVLGATPGAFEAAVMSRHPVVAVVSDAMRPSVVLCSTATASTRAPRATSECSLPDYRVTREVDPYRVLTRLP